MARKRKSLEISRGPSNSLNNNPSTSKKSKKNQDKCQNINVQISNLPFPELNTIAKQILLLRSTKDFKRCQTSLNEFSRLLLADTSRKLFCEFKLLEKMTPKISIRLRNSVYSRALDQLSKLVKDFVGLAIAYPVNVIKLCFDGQLNLTQLELEQHCLTTEKLAEKVFKIIHTSTRAFKLAQVWLDLGHLIDHFLIISCVTSRICVCCKALLYHLYDIYRVILKFHNLSQVNDKKTAKKTKVDKVGYYFHKLNLKIDARPNFQTIKPKRELSTPPLLINTITKNINLVSLPKLMKTEDQEESSNDDEDIGVPLLKSVTSLQEQKSKKPNKKNNKKNKKIVKQNVKKMDAKARKKLKKKIKKQNALTMLKNK